MTDGGRELRAAAARYYAGRLEAGGPTPQGVDWNSAESQELRFQQLARLLPDQDFSVVDYGCGYGALYDYLTGDGRRFRYHGYDVAEPMIQVAADRLGPNPSVSLTTTRDELVPADFAVASGVLNVKGDAPTDAWKAYVYETIDDLASLGERGFGFNVLTAHSDVDRQRADLFYADPSELLCHCLKTYSRHVALLHDYGLYEFTVLVRCEAP